jgi:predicted dehydrogenase
MAPIRLGLIGLSKTGWARNAHVPYILANPSKYQIVAIQNTSVASAQTAIAELNLPATTKAYGAPEDLANDPDVDLVVVSVRVDRHFAATKPLLEAGKNVLVEFPLGRNLAEARELVELRTKHGVQVAVTGLQGRQALVVRKLRELLEGGRIGKVLSSTFVGQQDGVGGPTMSQSVEFATSREIGANLLAVGFGHIIDVVEEGKLSKRTTFS